MRRTIILLAAVALGASPAAAQNNAVDANAIAANNAIAADPNMTAPVNDLTAAPEMAGPLESETTFEEEGVVTGERNRGFPWGLIGLIGLVGLLGRSRR